MRIGVFDPYLDSLSGGEKYMLTAASCLSKLHEVFVFWNTPNILTSAQKKFGIDVSKVGLTESIFSPHLSLFKRLQMSEQYDAIFYLSDGSIPVVATKLFLHFQFPVRWVGGRTLKTKIKLSRVKNVICNSLYTKAYIDNIFNINSLVVYPPASGMVNIQQEQKQNMILSVGRLAEIREGETFKKQELMIAMFREMIDAGLRNWNLVLVVSYTDADQESIAFLKNQIGHYPIAIIENAANEILCKLYATAKIYWHAAGFGEDVDRHPDLVEHFGMTTVEAMEQGAVPIVVNLGGQREIVDMGKNGFLWNTKAECLSQTQQVINNESLWHALSQEAQQKSKQFSYQAFNQNITSIIT